MVFHKPAAAARYLRSQKGFDYQKAREILDSTEPSRMIENPENPGFFTREWSEEDLDNYRNLPVILTAT